MHPHGTEGRAQPTASEGSLCIAATRLMPLDAKVERELRLQRLQRLISRQASELAALLGSDAPKLAALMELLAVYRRRRERAYFVVGHETAHRRDR